MQSSAAEQLPAAALSQQLLQSPSEPSARAHAVESLTPEHARIASWGLIAKLPGGVTPRPAEVNRSNQSWRRMRHLPPTTCQARHGLPCADERAGGDKHTVVSHVDLWRFTAAPSKVVKGPSVCTMI